MSRSNKCVDTDVWMHFNAIQGPINNYQYEGKNVEDSNAVDCIFTRQCFGLSVSELSMKPSMGLAGWISG